MSYNGSGTFLINSAGQPVVANTVISATVFNALTADLATGLSTAITKDGQTTVTANIPFGNNKITTLGAGTAATDAANLGQVQSTAAKLITVTGTDTITGSMSPQLTAYAAGQLLYFIANAANTGAVTINVDGLGAKAITRDGSTALAAGDINSGEVVVIVYDGTRFQMINAANSFGNTTINGTLTVTGNTGLQANVSITSALSVGGTFNVTGAATLGSTLSVTGKSDLPTVSTASINAAVALITTGTVTNLTATGASIASANIGNLQFTAASIASINAGVAVITNLTATSASIASANVGTAVITTGTVTNLTSTSASIASANAAVALVTTGTVTNLTSTSASIASANLGTAVVTGLTVTGASIASVNVGAAVLSGNLTLSGGTANGVLYLNASKVATSGSALTFDGAAFGVSGTAANLAVFTSSGASTSLQLNNTNANGWGSNLAILTGGTAAGYFGTIGSLLGTTTQDLAVYATAGNAFRVYTNGNNLRAIFDSSGNLGLGVTPSGVFKFEVQGSIPALFIATSAANTPAYGAVQINRLTSATNNGVGVAFNLKNSADAGAEYGYVGALIQSNTASSETGSIIFSPTSSGTRTERMRIDSSGNLGLGVTPSAWSRPAIQGGAAGTVFYYAATNVGVMSANMFYDGNNKYIGNGFATQYSQSGGVHSWFNAPSGTAGNAITFTQALTLDANVNLLLNGTTAPASGVGTFAIFNGTAPTGSVTNGCVLYTEDVSSSSELKVRDEAGNVTTLSPHNFSLIPEGASEDMAWAYYSEKGGKRINVDMLKLARMVEKLTGEKLVYEA